MRLWVYNAEMKTSVFRCETKFGLLFFLGHPNTQLESPWDKGYPADCKNMQLEINFENCKTVSGVSGKVEHAKDIAGV